MTVLQKLVAADIWLMGKLGGKPRETLSSAAWNAHITGHRWWGWTRYPIDALFFVLVGERDHCRKDWEFRKEIYQ